MGELLPKQRAEAARKGWTALGVWAASGASVLFLHWYFVGVVAGGFAAWLTWQWFMFRAKWGMRF